jgi:transcriptional regulator with XRE-family HTH domain
MPYSDKIFADMESFYKRVHIKLIEQERKRSWLLAQTGIRPSTWSSWEKYGRIPPADRALAVAEALGVSIEFLVNGKETPFDLRRGSPLVQQILQQLEHLSERQLRRVLTAVNTLALED